MRRVPFDYFKDANAYGPDDAYPVSVIIPFPSTPWDCEYWVIKRDSMVWRHVEWFEDLGYKMGLDYRAWPNKYDAQVHYYFNDPAKALLFKLACGGAQ